MKDARKKLQDNYEKEIKNVDFRALVLRSIDGMRQMSPKLMGLENREVDIQHRMQSLEAEVKQLKAQNKIGCSF